MPYCARKHQLHNSLVYHIYNRSNAKVKVFHRDDDYRYFIKLLIEYSREFNIKLYHWVIMPNHYHLLLELAEPELISKCMAGLNHAYTCYYHRMHHSAGFLWQGRFKLQPVQKEQYLIACGRYIERNPVRAKIIYHAEDYFYSSAQYYCLGKTDELTTEDPCYVEFGNDATQRQAAYREFLRDFDEEQERSFANIETPQGSIEFVRRLIKENSRYFPRRRGRPKKIIIS